VTSRPFTLSGRELAMLPPVLQDVGCPAALTSNAGGGFERFGRYV